MSSRDDSQSRSDDPSQSQEFEEYRRKARERTVAGTALGAASAGAFALLGTVACPACVVAAPALVCSGVWNAKKARDCEGAPPDDQRPDGEYSPTNCSSSTD